MEVGMDGPLEQILLYLDDPLEQILLYLQKLFLSPCLTQSS